MNVDWPFPRLSLAPTRVNTRSTRPTVASSAGTKLPICARITARPACRSTVDFPAMLGPVKSITLPASSNRMSLGTNLPGGRVRSTTG